MNIEELLRAGDAELDDIDPGEDRAMQAFTQVCRRVDSDYTERKRICDLADLIDAEDASYQEAITALAEGDALTAEPLLRRAADAGLGEACYLLAGLLKQRGEGCEAIAYFQRAHLEGDTRATMMLADLLAETHEVARERSPHVG